MYETVTAKDTMTRIGRQTASMTVTIVAVAATVCFQPKQCNFLIKMAAYPSADDDDDDDANSKMPASERVTGTLEFSVR